MVENQPPERREKGERRKQEEYAFNRLSEAFETSARRWKLIVYSTLCAFIILAAYGFYLVKTFWPTRLTCFYPFTAYLPPASIAMLHRVILAAMSILSTTGPVNSITLSVAPLTPIRPIR